MPPDVAAAPARALPARSSTASTRRASSPTRSTGCPAATPRTGRGRSATAGRPTASIAAQVLSARVGRARRAARRLPRRAPAAGQRALEAAGHEGDRLHQDSSYADYLDAARDGHVLDLARRPAGRRRADALRARLAPVAAHARRSGRSSTRRRTGSRRRGPRRPTARSSTSCRSSCKCGRRLRSTTASRGTARRRTRAPARRGWRSSRTCCRSRRASTTTHVDPIYSRYRRHGDLTLDESFFPVVWDECGYRTPWLDASTI